ncbi:hypothetical protein GCM10009558_110810 [Virgisporangium aurantiacum]
MAGDRGRPPLPAGVRLVTGATKVVDAGSGDGVFVNTTGLGLVADGVDIRPERARPDDVVIVSGDIGVHGVAVLSCREGLEFGTAVRSDTAPLHGLVADLLATGADVHTLRDPTRGGVAATLNEIARAAGISTGTARDVRARITRGDDAVRPHRSAPHDGADAAVRVDRLRDPAALLHILRRDPSLRLTEHGRGLLRWLDARASGPAGGEAHLERLPAHCALLMAELARSCAQRWLEFADRLDDLAGAPDDLPAVQVRTMSG